jgi:hypothetical protein
MFNYSSAPQTFYVAIASGGVLWQQKYQLAALETKTLDIGSLIATGAKDESGLVLPAAATAGVAQWFTPNFGQGAGRLLVSQPSVALARNFGCQIMVVLGGTSSMPNNNVTIAAGSSGQMGPYQVDLYMGQIGFCGGTWNMTTRWPTNWTSSNPSVASIQTPAGPPTATINGNTAGSAGITAAGITEEYNYQPLDLQWWCTAPPQEGTVTVYDPGPSNVSISPTSFIVGATPPTAFTITGNNLGTNCPTLSFPFPASYSLSTPCQDQTITGTVTANGPGTGVLSLTAEGFNGQPFLPSPGQSQTAAGSQTLSASALQVSVTTADIVNNVIKVSLAGPAGATGYLNLRLTGSPISYLVTTELATPGTYSFTFSRPNLPVSDFSLATATWSVSGVQATGSANVAFYALGSTRFSTYNVPYESTCSGGTGVGYVFTSWSGNTCTFTTMTLNGQFMVQASTNGTGVSASGLILKAGAALNYCGLPPGATQGNSGNTFYEVTSITGQCNTSLSGGTSLATNPFPNNSNQDWNCNDQVLLVNSGDSVDSTKTVQDACPACSTPGHIDTFSSNQACSAHSIVDYGTFTAIRLR